MIDAVIAAHNEPADVRILVANFIEYAFPFTNPTSVLTAIEASSVFTQRIEQMVDARNDSRILLVDVATGFNSGRMTNDGVHPNVLGELHMAAAFLPVLSAAGLCPGATLELVQPQLIDPSPGSVLEGDSATFNWSSNGIDLTAYYLRVGTFKGDNTFLESGIISPSTLNRTVNGLPTDGSTVHVEFSYKTPTGHWVIRR